MFNKIFNAAILLGMTIAVVIITLTKLQDPDANSLMIIIASVGSIMGVLCAVFSANAKILTFVFGFIDVSIYGVMCIIGEKYGTGALHLLYFVPMQVVGFCQWRKRGADAQKSVQVRKLNKKKRLIYSGIFFIGLLVSYIILSKIGTSQESLKLVRIAILADAFSMMCNIFGQMLMSMAYIEQWIFWLGVNIASVIMWSATLASDPSSDYALVYIIKYGIYFFNTLNGMRIWVQLSRSQRLKTLK